MYQDITYEMLLRRMLDRVISKNPDIDTREGSVIYNALAPAAVELKNMYMRLDDILNDTFADTASRVYLIKRAAERGLAPYPAAYAVLKGEFNTDVPVGNRFALLNGIMNYTVESKISTVRHMLTI